MRSAFFIDPFLFLLVLGFSWDYGSIELIVQIAVCSNLLLQLILTTSFLKLYLAQGWIFMVKSLDIPCYSYQIEKILSLSLILLLDFLKDYQIWLFKTIELVLVSFDCFIYGVRRNVTSNP